ncbi:cation:proton antiporter [Enterococcus rivorum]|uniref:Sodium:proton antiporter n=1 Tax=Enterococcus rivorum TaxID=762845 RepID=A0A1E5KSE5_9ENTE|nr:cation:proton antiporter [Enterococcus rivorum]MBP2097450.1 monovalent cation:proton antiporter-2 (CPA2) family protein [Enterococcus rivorum]OEH80790.1 sodium:proton antiporter [Enterococcus rivorum]
MHFLGILGLILVTTSVAAHFSKKCGIPAVVGQLLVGILLGNAGLKWIHPDVLVHEFSEIGVILLMFLAGLESNLSMLKKYFRPGILVALFGILFPVAMGGLFAKNFNLSFNESLFIGIILAATSVSISVEVLKELNVMSSKEGLTILGASVVDDILVVFLLSVGLSFLTDGETDGGALAIVLLKQLGFFISLFFLIKWIIPGLIHFSQKIYVKHSTVIISLIICLGLSYMADVVGLSAVIGAFFAGVAIGQTTVKESVFSNVEILGYSLFIPVFFVSIGLEVNFTGFEKQVWFILLYIIIAVLTKLIGGFLGAKLAGFSNDSALMVGSGMISRGEMALIVLQIGYQAQLIDIVYYSPIVTIILVTTLMSPLIMKIFTKRIYH